MVTVNLGVLRSKATCDLLDDKSYAKIASSVDDRVVVCQCCCMSIRIKERKSKFTASVTEKLMERLDQKARQLKVNRSDAVEEAIEMWLNKLAEKDEEAYFTLAANEMNTDARLWNATTSTFARRAWE